MSVRDWAEAYRIAERLVRGEAAAGAIVWNAEVKEKYRQWMEANGRSHEYIKSCVCYLNRYVKAVSGPEDVVEAFNRCQRGRSHLVKALRSLFNFYGEVEGFPADFLNRLRLALPRVKGTVDYREASEDQVLETFRRLESVKPKYRAVWAVVLDGGVRLSHALKAVNSFAPERLVRLNGFCRYALGEQHGTKRTWFIYMRPSTVRLVEEAEEAATKTGVMRLLSHMKERGLPLVSPKLVRKFAYNKMVELGIPESVADWINGRTPRTVGAAHYMWIRRQADMYYPRYASYLDGLFKSL